MSNGLTSNDDTGGNDTDSFDRDALVSGVYNSFSRSSRERISREEIEQVVADLDLSDQTLNNRAPRLCIHRLHFTGEKRLRDEPIKPINYDQSFASGVNVILIPDNDVGKSSIMKTIKFALTGDNSDYDADVRKWITAIWLVFALDQRVYTVLLEITDDEIHTVLVPGEELRPIAEVIETVPFIFSVTGADQVKASLKEFFFQNLGLTTLSWNQRDASGGDIAERSTTWLTYFQALLIADGGHQYLICDAQHATGNQDGLILSAFLNLSLAETLNRLGIESKRVARDIEQERTLSEEEQRTISDKIVGLEKTIQVAREAITAITQAQRVRRSSFGTSEPVHQLTEKRQELAAKLVECLRLEQERDDLTGQIKRGRSVARRYREQAALALHFTGLTVSLCPNCDTPVSAEAASREQSTHECRLCGTLATTASADEIAALEAEANQADQHVEYLERGRTKIGENLAELRRLIEALEVQIPILQQAVGNGIDQALPTEEENAEHERQLIEIGRCQGEVSILKTQLSVRKPDIEAMDSRVRILEKVRAAIKKEADRRNAIRMERLSALTQELARQIGAESISDLSCTSLGKVQMRKHGEVVHFTGIHNEGERLRIKLAFFTAMMRLGREPGLGRHPGFLLIDQPGSGEMVPDDFQELAAIFRQIDSEHADDMQIICFTARPQFFAATEPAKVYGAQAPPYAF